MKTLDQIASTGIPINSTNTPGSAGNHFTITASGSYYLTGNLSEFNNAINGILIAADNVVIDLNGYTLFGAGGNGAGITVSGNRNNIAIRNGVIRNWGGGGVYAEFAFYGRYENLHLSSNGNGGGLIAGPNSVISKCVAAINGGTGIRGGLANVITACGSRSNTGNGFDAGSGSSLSDCAASSNNGIGFFLSSGSSITNSSASANHSYGISVADYSLVRHCTANTGDSDGIVLASYCLALANNCVANNGSGMRVTGNRNRIEGNNFAGNPTTGLSVSSNKNIIIANTASDNLVNYNIVAGNSVGPVVVSPASAAINGNSAPAASVGSTDPHANISY